MIALSILSVISCNKGENKKIKSENTVEKDTVSASSKEKLALKNSTNEDGKIIHPFEVVHVTATQKLMDSLRNTMDEDEFMAIVDDNMYYTSEAQNYLDSINVKVVKVDAGTKLNFVSKTGKKYPYKTKFVVSEFVLFNGESKPEIADMVSINRHIEKLYYKNKK